MRLLLDPAAFRELYVAAQPFPHVVLDGLFPDDDLHPLVEAFPAPGATGWARFDNRNERKLGFHHERTSIAPAIRSFLEGMNSFEMRSFSRS